MKSVIITIILVALTAMSCAKLDVVATDSTRAFDDLLQKIPTLIHDNEDSWSIIAPDMGARLLFSKNKPGVSDHYVVMEIEAAPFIAAGLDPALLPPAYRAEDEVIIIGFANPGNKPTNQTDKTPLESYVNLLKRNRSSIGYHSFLDHYGINLGNGNLFEWAKDISTNDKDIVFVLDPKPFIDAGVDPEQIEGWVFAKVTVDDENLQPIVVDKILKPFDL